ncbi:MAG: GntR family transcriptional regulator, partial [Negativicutes bacterium]|nr:GntR family transcriptional regulator [Negativicutes bacterium]
MDLLTDSRTPKYIQIADVFRQRIARGLWRIGDRLATNEVLAQEFNVSRITVRQAVDLLARDKLLQAKQGVGTFISGIPKADRWLRVETTLADLAAVYRDTSPKILNISESKAVPNLLPE